MNTDRELLSKAAEHLSRHAHSMGDMILGDEIYKHLYTTEGTPQPAEEKVEKED